jgi:uncharacterized protein YecE (DUF72 family)
VATVRLGTCSWADEGLVKVWYPREVRNAADRLRYYAERFETVEVDSPFYRLPSPETAARWAERTPPGFVFHAKASKAMTGHEEAASRERVYGEFRESLSPLEEAGKLRGVLLQYHPRFVKSRDAKDELHGVAELLAPLVPLIEFRHRSWMEEDERADTLAFLEREDVEQAHADVRRALRLALRARGSGGVGRAGRQARARGARGVRDVQQQSLRLRTAVGGGAAGAARGGRRRSPRRDRAGAGGADPLLTGLS